jgi:SHAQKYF class myb-like DNA-binding protein
MKQLRLRDTSASLALTKSTRSLCQYPRPIIESLLGWSVAADVSKQKQYSGYIPTTPGVPWSEEEHRQFLAGLDKLGKGDWRGIARSYVPTRTPTQVASHAQKFFLRQSSMGKKKRRSSLFDMVCACRHQHLSLFFSVRNCLSFDNRVQRQVPICENSASISDPLDVARHGVASADSERAAVDVDLMNSTTEGDDGRSRDVVSSASGAGTALRFPAAAAQTEPLHPSSSHGHGRGHHCSPLDLELGMSLPAPSVGT